MSGMRVAIGPHHIVKLCAVSTEHTRSFLLILGIIRCYPECVLGTVYGTYSGIVSEWWASVRASAGMSDALRF
jgi:hypothetical protein